MKKKIIITALFGLFGFCGNLSLYEQLPILDGIKVEAASNTNVSKAINVSKYGTVTKNNYTLWRNFDWVKKGSTKDYYQSTLLVKYEYKHSNGSSYYSLYDSKSNWLGYVNSDAVSLGSGKQGSPIKVKKYATVNKNNYYFYKNFGWKKQQSAAVLNNQTLEIRNEYHHFNGSTYYSTYNHKGEWQGYINKNATKGNGAKGPYNSYNKYVSLTGDGAIKSYRNLEDLNEGQSMIGMPPATAILAKGFYRHFNGEIYYSLYDHKNRWLGYANKEDLVLDVRDYGKGAPVTYKVKVNRTGQRTYQNFNWKVKHQTKDLLNKEFIAKRVYYHSNGEIYYSLFDKNNNWYGYINSKFTSRSLPVITGVKDQTIYMSDNKFDALEGVSGKDAFGNKLEVIVEHEVDVKQEGIYSVRYTVLDKDKTQVEAYATITVVDDYAPVFDGVEDKVIEPSPEPYDYLLGISAKDFEGTELEISYTGEVNTRKAGKYEIEYSATDKRKHTSKMKATITVKEAAVPQLEGVTDTTINKSVGIFDELEGIQAIDYKQNPLNVHVEGTVDMNKSGVYELVYSVTDELGQTVSIDRKVTVVNDIKPTITGIEDVKQNIIVSSFDPMANVSAKDSDGNTIPVEVSGQVDPNKVGEYELTYVAEDTAGNRIQKLRKVVIFEVSVESISIDGPNVLKAGRTSQYVAFVFPQDAREKEILWTSSNEEVATVDQNGNLTTLKEGTTTIQAMSKNNVIGTKDVHVSNAIRGDFYISGMAIVNNIVKNFTMTFNNRDSETLYVKNIQISEDGSSFKSNYTEEDLKRDGISNVVEPGTRFSVSLGNRVGWYKDKMKVIITISTEDGITQDFETRPY